jgi:hypothetical protein
MLLNGNAAILNGSPIPLVPLDSFILPDVAPHGPTRLDLSNPHSEPVDMTLELVRSDGTVRATAYRTVQGLGFQHYDVFADLFRHAVPTGSDYLRVKSSQGVMPVQAIGSSCDCVQVLIGQDARTGAGVLYAPQYVASDFWRSTLSVINLDSKPGAVTLRLVADDGKVIGEPKVVPIEATGKISITEGTFFNSSRSDSYSGLVQGYVEINGGGLRLSGSISIGDAQRKQFCTVLPLISDLSRDLLFTHMISDQTYFTGLAFMNPSDAETTVKISLYTSDGVVDQGASMVVGPHQRKSGVLTEFFPDLVRQERRSGYMRVFSDRGIAGFALFGTNDLSNLTSIPAQSVP